MQSTSHHRAHLCSEACILHYYSGHQFSWQIIKSRVRLWTTTQNQHQSSNEGFKFLFTLSKDSMLKLWKTQSKLCGIHNICGQSHCCLLVYFLEQLRKKFPAHKSSFRQTKDAWTLLTATYRSVAEILALTYWFFELQRIRSFSVCTHEKTWNSDLTMTKLPFLAFSMG